MLWIRGGGSLNHHSDSQKTLLATEFALIPVPDLILHWDHILNSDHLSRDSCSSSESHILFGFSFQSLLSRIQIFSFHYFLMSNRRFAPFSFVVPTKNFTLLLLRFHCVLSISFLFPLTFYSSRRYLLYKIFFINKTGFHSTGNALPLHYAGISILYAILLLVSQFKYCFLCNLYRNELYSD